MKLFENFNKPIRLRKKIFLKQLSDYHERSINKGQSIYDEMSHNVVYPNLGNYQADMTISPLALIIFIIFSINNN